MTWIRIDDQMPDHPKIEPLSDAAFRWIIRALSYANRFLTDGRLPPAFLDRVPKAVRHELVTAAVWDVGLDGKTRIHHYRKYQRSKASIERDRKGMQERKRRSRHRQNVTPLVTRESRVTNASLVTHESRVSHTAPTQPNPVRTDPPLTPPLSRGEVKVVRADRKEAARIREHQDCPHDPRCQTHSICKEKLAVQIALKRQQVRREVQH